MFTIAKSIALVVLFLTVEMDTTRVMVCIALSFQFTVAGGIHAVIGWRLLVAIVFCYYPVFIFGKIDKINGNKDNKDNKTNMTTRSKTGRFKK